jgi:hypothetical protein
MCVCPLLCLQDERLSYASEPQSYLQAFLRREPATGELPLLLRTAHADAGKDAGGPAGGLLVPAGWLGAEGALTVMMLYLYAHNTPRLYSCTVCVAWRVEVCHIHCVTSHV